MYVLIHFLPADTLADVKNETWRVDDLLKLSNVAGHQDLCVKDSVAFSRNGPKDVS